MITKLNHVSFTVSDVEESARFYQKALGLKLLDLSGRNPEFSEKATGIKGAHLKIAYLSAGNTSVELIQYLLPIGEKIDTRTNNVGSAHACFNVDNFDSFIENLKDEGGKLIAPPQIIPGGPNKGRYMVYTEDPDGNTLEFISNKVYNQ